jgi:nitrogen fixation protein NifZ
MSVLHRPTYSTHLSAMKLGDPELHLPPTYDLDQKVRVTKVIRNDGTYPGEVTGKRLAEKGDEGYVIGIGTYLQTAYIYSVHFLETNRIVGCLGLELELAEDLSKPRE